MFTAAQFTIAKTSEYPKCPSTEEWIKDVVYIQYNISHKKNKIMPATWMDLEITIANEVSQRKTNTSWHHLHVGCKA